MDVEEQADDVQLDADRQKLDYENFIDDGITLLRHKRDTDVTDILGSDIRDGLDTQREDWLLQTEALHGARPRRITRERPRPIGDQTGVMNLEAAGGTGGRQLEHHGFQAPLLSPERQILMEVEVITPPRGGRQAPVTQMPPGGARAVPQIFTEVHPREGCPDRQKHVGSPVDRLVDTVAWMQVNTESFPECTCPSVFTTTKVPRFDGTTI